MWKVATWNVNSVNARLERLLAFLARETPHLVLLQELKCEDSKFPLSRLAAEGYHIATYGQKAYNGVAILSTDPISEIQMGFADGGQEEARFITATVRGVRVASAYVPNGQAVGAERYHYKLEWLARLRRSFEKHHTKKDRVLLGGDFNVAPEDRDVHDPEEWRGQILFSDPEKQALKNVCDWGLHDTFRKHHAEGGHYSWWDYRTLGFQRNRGLRIDFLLASEPLYELCTAARIDRDERKGAVPSDHAPVLAEFRLK